MTAARSLFAPNRNPKNGPVDGPDTRIIMLWVCLALLPGAALSVWWLGTGLLANFLFAAITALAVEYVCERLRGESHHASLRATSNGSALLSALLLALCLPAAMPAIAVVTATAFGIALGKQAFGGLGQNPFNPAIVGYVVALTAWPAASASWSVRLDDGWTGATALSSLQAPLGLTESERWTALSGFGSWGGLGFEWINLAFLLAGLLLLRFRLVSWHAPLGFLAGLGGLALLGYRGDSDQSLGSPLLHWFSGGTMLCAWFIVTDPVSGPATRAAQWWFGFGVGAMTFVIRAFGAHPDGAAYAILVMNAASPLLDRWTLTRAARRA